MDQFVVDFLMRPSKMHPRKMRNLPSSTDPWAGREEEAYLKSTANPILPIQVGGGGDDEEICSRWIKHYSSRHRILLVGEGDFSFAACLATAFGTAINMVATSLDSGETLHAKHRTSAANLDLLRNKGCMVLHDVDAHTMRFHRILKRIKFDRIVFNFPHAGFITCEHDLYQILCHQDVVRGFLKNGYEMLKGKGEIHITHKTAYPYNTWDIEELGEEVGLALSATEKFDRGDYPGYINKRGDGPRSNRTFRVGECATFKFIKC